MIEALGDLLPRPEQGGRIYGVVIGVVTNTKDPNDLGRVKLKFPWLSDQHESHWARMAAPMAGNDRGLFLPPEVDDEVLVMFEHGRPESPFVIGALWNGKDKAPAANSDGKNNIRMLKSRSGHTVVLDDTDGKEQIIIRDKGGKSEIVFDTAKKSVTITAEQDLNITAAGNITLESTSGDLAIKCKSFSVEAQKAYAVKGGQGSLEATQGLAVKCLAGVNVNDGALEVK